MVVMTPDPIVVARLGLETLRTRVLPHVDASVRYEALMIARAFQALLDHLDAEAMPNRTNLAKRIREADLRDQQALRTALWQELMSDTAAPAARSTPEGKPDRAEQGALHAR